MPRTTPRGYLGPLEAEADRAGEVASRAPGGPDRPGSADAASAARSAPRLPERASAGYVDRARQRALYPLAELEARRVGSAIATDAPATPRFEGPLPEPLGEHLGQGLGRDLSSVRVRHDARATATRGAVAFARRGEIVLGASAPSPETHAGRALLGHEVVHLAQQGALPAATSSPLPLRSASAHSTLLQEEPDLPDIVAPTVIAEADWLEGVFGVPAMSTVTVPDIPYLEDLEQADDEGLLVFSEDGRVALLPPSGMLFRLPEGSAATVETAAETEPLASGGTSEGEPTAQPPAEPEAQPWVGVPTIGRAGLRLVRTSMGLGFLIDSGRGRRVVLQRQLAEAMSTMEITSIAALLTTHGHSDHVGNLVSFVRAYSIRAENLRFAESWLQGSSGALMGQVRQLQTTTDADLVGLGYGASWTPTTVATSGTPLVETTFTVGGTRITAVAAEVEHAAYEELHRSSGSRAPVAPPGDAASLVYFFDSPNTTARTAVIGDVRGQTLTALLDRVGADPFEELFRDVNVLIGAGHHGGSGDLGAGTQEDPGRGLRGWEAVARSVSGSVTVFIQTTERDHSEAFGTYLSNLGFRVVYSMRGTGLASIDTHLRLETSGTGTRVIEAESTMASAMSRLRELRTMRGAVEEDQASALRLLRIEGGHESLASQIEEQEARLERLLAEARVRVGTNVLSEGEDETTRARIEEAREASRPLVDIHEELNRVEGVERELTPEARELLRTMALYGPTYRTEWLHFVRTGEARPALFESMQFVRPALARALEVDVNGQPTGRRYELVEPHVGAAAVGGGPSTGARIVAWSLIGIEIANMVLPAYQDWNQARLSRNLRPFMERIVWWVSRQAAPTLGGADDPAFAASEVFSGEAEQTMLWERLGHTIWDRLPSEHRAAEEPPGENLQAIWIEDVPDEQLEEFALWCAVNIRNYDDFARHFIDTEQDAVRWECPDGFAQSEWYIRVGRYDTDWENTVEESWVYSEKLTELMRPRIRALIQGTTEDIETRWATREPPPPEFDGPSISALDPDEEARSYYVPSLSLQDLGEEIRWDPTPTRMARFAPDASRELYSEVDPDHQAMDADDWWTQYTEPIFLVYENAPRRGGMVLVSGADYNTYGAMRNAEVRTYDQEAIVLLPKAYYPLYEVLPRHDWTEEQQDAWDASISDPNAEFVELEDDSTWMGAVRFWYLTPNSRGYGYVSLDDLEFGRRLQRIERRDPMPAEPDQDDE